ncbi:MAG: hypothetical protein ACR2JY_01260 [Chloroflexota bacterium]
MKAPAVWQRLRRRVFREHGDIKSFDQELEAAGGLKGRYDAGVKIIPTRKVVGSVGRSHNLRSDFFYKSGRAMTDRFVSIGKAMHQGKILPPLELYKVKQLPDGSTPPPPSEYYVVDGHHRVAMARKLGQDFLDAHVVEYRVATKPPQGKTNQPAPTDPPPSEAPSVADTSADVDRPTTT